MRPVFLTHEGRTQSLAAWARELGITRERMRQRLAKNCPPERLFAGANEYVFPAPVVLKFAGQTKTMAQWAADLGVPKDTIRHRRKERRPIRQVLHPGRLKHKPYACGACGELGHNRRTCEAKR